MMVRWLFIMIGLVLLVSPGCTRQAWFEGFKERERQRCQSYINQDDVQSCLDRIHNMSYEQYIKSREKRSN